MTKILGDNGSIRIIEVGDDIQIDIDPTYRGQVSINTVGVIKMGEWEGNTIKPKFGGTGVDNGTNTLKLNGNLIIDCEESHIEMPSSGKLCTEDKTLQIHNHLSELKTSKEIAFNNISPLSQRGDIIAHDGKANSSIPLGKENQYLGINLTKNTGIEWLDLPSFYHTIYEHGSKMPKRDNLEFYGSSFDVTDTTNDDDTLSLTRVSLTPNLENLSLYSQTGLVQYSDNKFKGVKLKAGNGISILNPDGKDGDPFIGISDNYIGQDSINTVGVVRAGSWCANAIKPEFGGTGVNNQSYTITLNGNVVVDGNFSIKSNNASNLLIHLEEDSRVTFPAIGTLATQEKSLQSTHNLRDVDNPRLAFHSISPCMERGDLIVQGYGYEERLSVGRPGQVLTVSENTQHYCGIEWRSPLTLDDVIEYCETIINTKLALYESQKKTIDNTILEKKIKVILMQLDSMIRSGQIQGIKEMRDLLSRPF